MKRKWKGMTAAESDAILKGDPEWVRQNEERESRFRALEAQFRAEEKPILADLSLAGYRLNSVWDLVNSSASYHAAIPVLCKHLRVSYHPRILEGIVRALTVRESRGTAGREILDELKRRGNEPPSELRWALANALTVAADMAMTDEIQLLVADARFEDVRERLTQALHNLVPSGAQGRVMDQRKLTTSNKDADTSQNGDKTRG